MLILCSFIFQSWPLPHAKDKPIKFFLPLNVCPPLPAPPTSPHLYATNPFCPTLSFSLSLLPVSLKGKVCSWLEQHAHTRTKTSQGSERFYRCVSETQEILWKEFQGARIVVCVTGSFCFGAHTCTSTDWWTSRHINSHYASFYPIFYGTIAPTILNIKAHIWIR